MRALFTLCVLSMMACGIQAGRDGVANDESSLKGGARPDGGQKNEDRDGGENENENEANEHADGGNHRADGGEVESEDENENADGGDDDGDGHEARDGGGHSGHH
jgi:hypothetical protein